MPLTPADVHNVAFKKPPIGKRGYDEDEVDAFLDEVERELARLIEDNNELRASVRRCTPVRRPVPAPTRVSPRRTATSKHSLTAFSATRRPPSRRLAPCSPSSSSSARRAARLRRATASSRRCGCS